MNAKTIVVLGGGVGGLVVSNELRRRLARHHRIVLVEKTAEHAFAPSFLWLMVGGRRPESITRPLGSLVHRGIEVVQAEAKSIDIPNRSVATSERTFGYDYLVIALGAELAPEAIPGLSQTAHSFYTFQETRKLQQTLAQFNGGNVTLVVCSVPYKCPGAPHEAAMLMADYFRRRGIQDKVDIHLYTPEPQPMPVAGPQLGEAVKQMLTSKGISFHPLHKLASLNALERQLVFDGIKPVRYDLLIAIPPHRAPSLVREAKLVNEAGWIPVDRFTLKTKIENIYAIGDITSLSIPGRWKPDVPMMLPKAGVFAHAQAEVVARRVADDIAGRTSTAEFCGTGYCMLEAGEGLAGFAFGDFFGEPAPELKLRDIGKAWHLGKVLFEKWWLSPFGVRKTLFRSMLSLGARVLRIPVNV
ncbi:MAG: FAD/NAD(P)-binding oxidoreductase [Candidatus Eisenbacteria bacterium]|nr:FAD/NAD(P)-binding oxidoreductase [Candidatus Eisenbacteria bacterium]